MRHHGKNARLYMADTGSGAPALVASVSEWTIDTEPDRVDTTSFGDGNKTSVQGYPAMKGTFAFFWDDAEDTLFTAAESEDGAAMILYPDYVNYSGSKYAKGTAWVSASLSASATDAVKGTGSWEAKDTWTVCL